MRRELLAATAIGSTLGLGVWAVPAFAQSTVRDWSGPYLGGSLGANFRPDLHLDIPEGGGAYDAVFEDGALVFDDTPDLVPAPWPTDFDFDARFNAGVEAGFNFQKGRVVFGLEADYTWLGNPPTTRYSLTEGPAPDGDPLSRTTDISVSGGVDHLFTFRPRVGVAATDRLLLFATGGLAIGDAHISSSADIAELYTDQAKSAEYSGSRSEIMSGFAVGGGAQYALTDNISLKLDGLYYDLGELSTTIEGAGSDTDDGDFTVQPYRAKMQMDGEIIRLGVRIGF
jgi:outer membrane immunogenic protein